MPISAIERRRQALRQAVDQSAEPSAAPEPAQTWRPAPLTTTAEPLRRLAGDPGQGQDPLGGAPIPDAVLSELSRGRGRGGALPDEIRAAAQPLLGADLSGVRLHTDARADVLARSVQSVAFSHGNDVYFSAGSYRPQSDAGSRLLAHELSHVAEGSRGSSSGESTAGGIIGRADDAAETRADRAADYIAPALRRSVSGPFSGSPSASLSGLGPERGPARDRVIADTSAAEIHRMTLRRRISSISKTSADIAAANGGTVTQKSSLVKAFTGAKDSLYKIGVLLDQQKTLGDKEFSLGAGAKAFGAGQSAADKEGDEILNLAAIVTMCEHWLKRHQDGDPALVALIEDIYAEARRDYGRGLAQQRYLVDLDDRVAGSPTPFTQQIGSELGRKGAQLANHGARQTDQLRTKHAKQVSALAKSAGLTQAEITAIVAYTAADYLYINPAVANSRGWLAGQQEAIKGKLAKNGKSSDNMDQDQMFAEGATHAGVAMQALAKMPVMKGTVYRGARMSEAAFKATYVGRTQIVYHAFTSTTYDKKSCDLYARGGGDKPPAKDQTVSVKCILEVTDARNVELLSEAMDEKEWLLLPGATFTITKIEDDPVQDPGLDPKATAWKIVRMRQVPNAGDRKAPLRPAKPAPSAPPPASPKTANSATAAPVA